MTKVHLSLLVALGLITTKGHAQTFSEDFVELERPLWKESVRSLQVDPMMDSVWRASTGKGFLETLIIKNEAATYEEIERIRQVIALTGNDLDSIVSFTMISEQLLDHARLDPSAQRTIVIAAGRVHGSVTDPAADTIPKACEECIPDTSELSANDPWSLFAGMLIKGQLDELEHIARSEAETIDHAIPATRQFEIIEYNQGSKPSIQRMFLHDEVKSR